MNETGFNADTRMFAGKLQSWTRDTATANVQTSWGALYRDVFILDPLNKKIDSYNLTDFPLTIAANRATMKNKLLAAATPADTDNDKIPDYWETWAYGNLSHTGATAGPGGRTTLQHWAHCSFTPATSTIRGLPEIYFVPSEAYFSVLYIRRRGTSFGLTVTPEFSPDLSLSSWTTAGTGYEEWGVMPLYDGSGGELVEWSSTVPAPLPFARIKAVLP